MDMETFKARVENWKDAWPKLTYQALKGGTNLVRDEIKRRWSGPVLKSQSGKLVKAVQSKVRLNPLSAKVDVRSDQQYKAQTHERGLDLNADEHKTKFFQLGPPTAQRYGRPRFIHIPARPVFHQAKQDKIKDITSLIEKTVVEGWQKA